MNGREVFEAGRLKARALAPYLRSLLVSFIVIEAPGLGTIACTARGVLMVDFDWLAQFSVEEVAGLILHECMHRLNAHHARCGARDLRLWNRAGDRAINPAVLKMGARLPSGEHTGCFPRDLGLADGLTADEYYEHERRHGHGHGNGGGGARQDGGGKGPGNSQDVEDGEERPACGGGWCGSCAGRPVPGEPKDGGRSDAELGRINRQAAEAIRDWVARKGRGSVPADLARWAEDMLKPSVVRWQDRLRVVTRYGVAWRAGAVEHRWDGPGRRQAGLGYGPGRPIMPRLRAPVPRVAVVIDTSGSMGKAELSRAASETDAILREINAEVTVCTIDAEIHGLRKVRTIRDAIDLFRGGGGTDFRPAFEKLAESRPRPELVIFATDGQGPAPKAEPLRTIWLLVGRHRAKPCEWGQFVEVDEAAEVE
jgi:predicted metal-dependent peptidase